MLGFTSTKGYVVIFVRRPVVGEVPRNAFDDSGAAVATEFVGGFQVANGHLIGLFFRGNLVDSEQIGTVADDAAEEVVATITSSL